MLGLCLDADAIRPLHIAADQGPADADEEHDARGIAHRGKALIHAAVEELRALGHLVVDLEHRRDTEQDEEAEVDHRVHDARCGVSQQRLHVHAGAEVAEAPPDVLRGGGASIGCASLVVADTLPEEESGGDDEQRGDDVERESQWAGDAAEDLA